MSDVPRALRPCETVSVWEELENKEMPECFPSVRQAGALGGAPRWSQQPATRGACHEGHSLLHGFFFVPTTRWGPALCKICFLSSFICCSLESSLADRHCLEQPVWPPMGLSEVSSQHKG